MSIVGKERSDGRQAKVAKGLAKVAMPSAKVAMPSAKVAMPSATLAGRLATLAMPSATLAGRLATLAMPSATLAGRLATLAMPSATFAGRLATFARPRGDLHPRGLSSAESHASPMTPSTRLVLQSTVMQLALGGVLFGAAGTWRFWPAWAYLAANVVTGTVTNVHLIRHDPALLVRRLRRSDQAESDPLQRFFQALVAPLFVGILAVAGLDHRFGWSHVPPAVVVAGQALALASYLLVYLVFRENTFASSVIEVDAGQRVVASGPYRFVRHPMYTGMVLGALATPVALGSTWAEVFFVPLVALIAMRLLREERFLREKLPGYTEYSGRTRFRLVPGAW